MSVGLNFTFEGRSCTRDGLAKKLCQNDENTTGAKVKPVWSHLQCQTRLFTHPIGYGYESSAHPHLAQMITLVDGAFENPDMQIL